MEQEHEHVIVGIENIGRFVLAGRALFTVENDKTGGRFTFRVTAFKGKAETKGAESAEAPKGPFFVKVLTGPCNTADYTFLGTVFVTNQDGTPCSPRFVSSKKSPIAWDAPSAKAIWWLVAQVAAGRELPEGVRVWHHGTCGRCGRVLTTPESISQGVGPVCAGR